METLSVDRALLEEFERELDPLRPEKNKIPASILGYGEISTVFTLNLPGQESTAYKRMPLFNSESEAAAYKNLYDEYNRILCDTIGLQIPPHGTALVDGKHRRRVLFLAQKKLLPDSIGNRALRFLSPEQTVLLVRLVLRELKKVFLFNVNHPELQLGIDGQISNWAVENFSPEQPVISEKSGLLYLDTSTPLMHKNGAEQLDPELFLRSAPSFLVWLIRLLFLKDVMTRYYDFRLVTVDLIANFYKEQKAQLIPPLLSEASRFFSEEAAGFHIAPVTEKEVSSYYKQDKLIWTLFLSFRRIDRFLRAKVLRKEYPFILPGNVKR